MTRQFKKGMISPKLVFFVMLVVIVLTAVALLTKGSFLGLSATTGKLYFSTTLPAATAGKTVSVPIYVTTGGNSVRAVDVVVSFDKNKLLLTSVTPTATMGTPPAFPTFLPQVSGKFDSVGVSNNANSTGKVSFSALALDSSQAANGKSGLTAPFNGSTQVATLNFTAIAAGMVQLSFDFVPAPPGATTESNLAVDGGTDALGSVGNVSLTINAPTTPPPAPTPIPPPPPPAPSPSPTPSPVPPPSTRNLMRVSKITFQVSGTGLVESELVVDSTGKPIAGAGVGRIVKNTTLNKAWDYSSKTGEEGVASWTISNAPSGCYTTTFTSVVAPGYKFDGVLPTNQFCK